jgi:cysteinyl-tRNA synthetase
VGLIEKGYLMRLSGCLLRVKAFAGLGKLSRRSLDEMLAGARVESMIAKRSGYFALWKKAKAVNQAGRVLGEDVRGWHIESRSCQ